MDRKRGSILIEALPAIFIAAIAMIIYVRLYVFMNKNIEEVNMKYKDLESINAVSNELKYNIKFDILKDRLQKENMYLKYDAYFLERLMKEELFDLSTSYANKERIEISLVNVNKNSFNIKVILHRESKEIEEVVEKGIWMDYV